jgi:hypothetical protein
VPSDRAKKSAYAAASRDLAVGYVFMVPLILVYELGVLLDPTARNGADPLFRQLVGRFGAFGVLVLHLALLSLLFFALARAVRAREGRPGIYGLMFLEAVFWAAALRGAAHFATARLLQLPGFARVVVVAAGAGVYEEVVFRLFLLGGLLWAAHRALGAPRPLAVAFALAFSSALFSLAHHGIGGEPWDARVFLFRAAMGAALGAVFLARGLGIAAYTHALYNVLVLALDTHG